MARCNITVSPEIKERLDRLREKMKTPRARSRLGFRKMTHDELLDRLITQFELANYYED